MTNADWKRPFQYTWNQMVRIGRGISKVVDISAFFVLNRPIIRSCDTTTFIIKRRCTSGQNAAPLSYIWLYTLMTLQNRSNQVIISNQVFDVFFSNYKLLLETFTYLMTKYYIRKAKEDNDERKKYGSDNGIHES